MVMTLLVIVAAVVGHAQNTQVSWSVFSSAFGEVSSENTRVLGMTGQPFAGEAGGPGDAVFTGFLADPSLSGTVTGVSSGGGAQAPGVFQMLQNYPNPFNPSTMIRYDLPSRAHVLLRVFNALGQQIAVLQNGQQDAGSHNVRWAAEGLPSGVYLYRLQVQASDPVPGRDARDGSQAHSETKRMLLIR
jgi:hypothetical protein